MIKFIALFFLLTSALFADTYVRGHYKKSGSYVKGHYRSTKDASHNNNWSTRGNVNPYTGSIGTKPRKVESGYYNYGRKKKSKRTNGVYGY